MGKRRVFGLLLGAVALIAGGWWWWRGGEVEGVQEVPVEGAGPRVHREALPSGPTAERVAPPRGSGWALTEAGWGSGRGQLGRRQGDEEGGAEVPSSFGWGADGGLVVLDQVNGRLLQLGAGGSFVELAKLRQGVPEDVALAADGTALVLDRLVDKSVAVLRDGRWVGSLPLEGKNVPEGDAVTGLLVDGEDVYVERERGPLVRVGNTHGTPDLEQPEVPGRPSRDGKSYLMAGIVDPREGRVFLNSIDRATLERRFTRELRLGQAVVAVLLLDTDKAGTIYLGVLMEPRVETPTESEPGAYVSVHCLRPEDGTPLGSVMLSANTGPEETLRQLVVLDEGGVIYAQRSEQGIRYERHECQ